MSNPMSSQGTYSIRPRVFYPASRQLPRRLSHRQYRHPSDVASPTKNPIVVVAIELLRFAALGFIKKGG